MREIKDLTNIYGFKRLYKTLIKREDMDRKETSDLLYDCYLANRSALAREAELIEPPIEREIFFFQMENNLQNPYITEIQTIKALTLLEWNMDDSDEFAGALHRICDVKGEYTREFENMTGYSYTDNVTSFSLCRDSLDPDYEPDLELNPNALMRLTDLGPKLVYISAPLRGEVEKNIEFAKEKARLEFEYGNIPICPHLMFSPIADPTNPTDDKQAMKMCLKLIERCNEVHVYGDIWTEGMWQEIRHAWKQQILVLTDSERIPKTRQIEKKHCR